MTLEVRDVILRLFFFSDIGQYLYFFRSFYNRFKWARVANWHGLRVINIINGFRVVITIKSKSKYVEYGCT